MLPLNHNQMQRNARKIVKKSQHARSPQGGARWAEEHWGLVAAPPGVTTFGTVTFPTVKVYIDGTGTSPTSLGNSVATNPQPVPVRYMAGATFAPGQRCLLRRMRGDSRAGGNWIAVGTLEGDAVNSGMQAGNVEITATGIVVLGSCTSPVNGLYQVNMSVRVGSSSSSFYAVTQGNDEVNFQAAYHQYYVNATTLGLLDGVTLSANTSYMCLPITIRIAAGATLEFYVEAGTANTCFVSYSISEVGSV